VGLWADLHTENEREVRVPILGEGAAAKVLDIWVESQDKVFRLPCLIVKSTQKLYHSSSTGEVGRCWSFLLPQWR